MLLWGQMALMVREEPDGWLEGLCHHRGENHRARAAVRRTSYCTAVRRLWKALCCLYGLHFHT
jgi:hypothetical protein